MWTGLLFGSQPLRTNPGRRPGPWAAAQDPLGSTALPMSERRLRASGLHGTVRPRPHPGPCQAHLTPRRPHPCDRPRARRAPRRKARRTPVDAGERRHAVAVAASTPAPAMASAAALAASRRSAAARRPLRAASIPCPAAVTRRSASTITAAMSARARRAGPVMRLARRASALLGVSQAAQATSSQSVRSQAWPSPVMTGTGHRCQSASKFDPLSAFNIDPLSAI